MEQDFDAFEYAGYLGSRWRVIVGTCLVAVLLTGVISLLLPKRYTASASVLIDPPAGNDSRTATAVSPVYLESLKTYEHFASSDTLFQKAIDKFQLADSGSTAEGMKSRILKVSKPRDTKILEISATLPDPRKAQALVQFLAEETVRLSQSLLRDGEGDMSQDAQRHVDASRSRFDAAQASWNAFSAGSSIESLRAELESAAELKARIRRESIEAAAEVAELERRKTNESDRSELEGARARTASLDKQYRDLDAEWKAKSAILASQQTRMTHLSAGLEGAKTTLDAAAAHLRDVQNSVGYRGERLKVIDPGVVPQRPSSPNVMLNLLAASLVALTASVVLLSIGFVRERRRAGVTRGRPVAFDH
ncbi:MAG: Wzz/FepE/Etk N-terminal domain-containing protein [Bryobacteraceae bacterium]